MASNSFPLSSEKMNPLVGVCQMTSTADKEANFAVCQALIHKAKKLGVQVIVKHQETRKQIKKEKRNYRF